MVFSLVVFVVAVIGWAILVYNFLVRDRNRVAQAWSDVDVQLTRRYDLVPRLVEIVKGYANYERALLTSLAELRSHGVSAGSRTEIERAVSAGVKKLIALVEAYPDLKANENFLELHRKLVDTENQIQYARRYYNGAVNLYNNRIQQFPDLLVARAFRFEPADLFDPDEPGVKKAPNVALS